MRIPDSRPCTRPPPPRSRRRRPRRRRTPPNSRRRIPRPMRISAPRRPAPSGRAFSASRLMRCRDMSS
ncbi:MAG: hypothetical protein EPO23_03290 [Xanthobacteraceae bacterium]|nr:MAG: hypothetical protein EPO23_03290 [Xanthobacteraceae bacterium]